MSTAKKPRYVKTIVPLASSQVDIYAGKRVAYALKELQNPNIYQGAKLIDLVEAAYDQGKKDGARTVSESFEKMMASIPHQNPGRPKLKGKKTKKKK